MDLKTYAGIGSRQTPAQIIQFIYKISAHLEQCGFVLRSGGARGADVAFQRYVKQREIFLPQYSFNGFTPNNIGMIDVTTLDNYNIAKAIASKYHPKWKYISTDAKRMMTRNVYQVLGLNLSHPSNFIICWTQDGAFNLTSSTTGGTGQAIRMAVDLNIPVYNLNHLPHFNKIASWLDSTDFQDIK